MSGQQLTALERLEQHEYLGGSAPLASLVWLADWRAIRVPYCSIYVIAPADGWPCKIGISTAPRKRVAGLQTACWKQLDVKWCGFLANVQQAKELERRAHRALTDQAKWLHGEWFDLRPDKAVDLVQFEAALGGMEVQTELPAGISRDFVYKLLQADYSPGKGMEKRLDREAEFFGRK